MSLAIEWHVKSGGAFDCLPLCACYCVVHHNCNVLCVTVPCIVCCAFHCGATAVRSGSNVSVVCSRVGGAAWPSRSFQVKLSVAAGSGGCSATSDANTVVTPVNATTLALSGPNSVGVCPTSVSGAWNYTISSSPAGAALSSVTVASTGPACSVTSTADGENLHCYSVLMYPCLPLW